MAAAAKEALQHYDGYLEFFRKDGRLPELYGFPMLRIIDACFGRKFADVICNSNAMQGRPVICTLPMTAHDKESIFTDNPRISMWASLSKVSSQHFTEKWPVRMFIGGSVAVEDGHLLSKCFEAARCLHRLQPPDARTP